MNQISDFLNHLLTYYLTQTLTTIDLSHNGIGVQGAEYLANALEENEVTQLSPLFFVIQLFTRYPLQVLTTLIMAHNRIGDQGAQQLANALQKNNVI